MSDWDHLQQFALTYYAKAATAATQPCDRFIIEQWKEDTDVSKRRRMEIYRSVTVNRLQSAVEFMHYTKVTS